MALPVGAMVLWFLFIGAVFGAQALDLTTLFLIPLVGAAGYIVGAPVATFSALKAFRRWRETKQIRGATVALMLGVGLFLISPWLTTLLIKFVQGAR